MAIIQTPDERILDLMGTKNIIYDNLITEATRIRDSFRRVPVNNLAKKPIYPDLNANLIIANKGKKALETDVSEYAFGQVCNLIGVPARYMKQLYTQGLNRLAETNIYEQYKWLDKTPDKQFGKYIALVSGNTTEAIVSDKYSFGFQTPEILETIRDNMPENYVPNQAYLSNSRFYARFIDPENKVKVGGEDLTVGFTVGTSDIGKSSLCVKFFLYKFACTNGIVRISKGGTLYRQTHIGEPFTSANIQQFKDCFKDITKLRTETLDLVASSQKRMMSLEEMHSILDTCKKVNVSISEKERDNIIELASQRYGMTKWGLINGITEVAQNHTLDTRINYEAFAGRLLEKIS